MNKHLMSFSIIFLGICILLGSWLISQSLKSEQVNKTEHELFRYELISPNDSNIIIFDKQSGEYWRKFIEPNEGPIDWENQPSPFSNSLK
ncbi:hypothetical protein ACIQ1H_05165 [Lysinibacillus sp. NPDC097279]|uniref:hypothetical protein n=1 Tax=Lysinibacillus sp. NPDC097279 TaxID=3364143 RepID=UPI00382B1436